MSQGHYHAGGANMTQNQGNMIGDRPCVRQSRLYREHVGGNAMKELLGQDTLKWDTNRTQGAYQGGRVYDHNAPLADKPKNTIPETFAKAAPVQQEQPRDASGVDAMRHRRGAGQANKQTYNFMTGQ